MKRTEFATLLIGMAMLILAACGQPHEDTATMHLALREWQIEPMHAVTLPQPRAGAVVFEVHNTGVVPHEVSVIKLDREAATLAAHMGQVDIADAGTSVGRITEIAPRKIGVAEFRLVTGQYLLVCTIPGHYEQGMYTTLVVK